MLNVTTLKVHLRAMSISLSLSLVCSLTACTPQRQLTRRNSERSSVTSPNSKTSTERARNVSAPLKVKVFVDLSIQQQLVALSQLTHLVYQPFSSQLTPHRLPDEAKSQPPHISKERSTLYQLSAPLKALIDEVNLITRPQGLSLELSEISSWSSETNGVQRSLISLAQELNKRAREDADRSPQTLYLGLTNTTLPSFAQLSDLRWSSLGSPFLVIRSPRSYYGGAIRPTIRALARLVINSLARSLGAVDMCGRGWSNASRDEILGLITLSGALTPKPEGIPTQREPFLGTRPANTPAESTTDLNQPWRFRPLKWTQLSSKVLRRVSDKLKHAEDPWKLSHAESCELFRDFMRECPTSTSLKSFAHQCFLEEHELISSYQRGELEGDLWRDERESARGLEALSSGDPAKALRVCIEIARRQPSMLASKCAGLASYRLNKLDSAILYLRAYLSSHPYDVKSSSTLARILGERDEDKDAVSLLRSLIQGQRDLGEERGKIYLNLGVGEARLGRWAQAQWAWRQIRSDEDEYQRAQELLREFAEPER